MTDLADVWLDFDDTDECTDLWHLDQGPAAGAESCPSCGFVVGGEESDVEWPDDVFVRGTAP